MPDSVPFTNNEPLLTVVPPVWLSVPASASVPTPFIVRPAALIPLSAAKIRDRRRFAAGIVIAKVFAAFSACVCMFRLPPSKMMVAVPLAVVLRISVLTLTASAGPQIQRAGGGARGSVGVAAKSIPFQHSTSQYSSPSRCRQLRRSCRIPTARSRSIGKNQCRVNGSRRQTKTMMCCFLCPCHCGGQG